jgi:hypothetical protein
VAPLLLIALAGCYPHSQAYRGAFSGRIVDANGQPVVGATVVVCTSDSKSFDGCPRRADAWTDADGRFQFWPVKEKSWCCFGAAPLPATHLTACAHDRMGRFLLASSVVVDTSGATEPQISVAPSRSTSVQDACAAPK